MDAPSRDALEHAVHRHAAGGGAVVLATHDVELAARCATHAIVLGDGEVVADGDARDVLVGLAVRAAGAARAAAVPHRGGSRAGAGPLVSLVTAPPPTGVGAHVRPVAVYSLMVAVGAAAFLYPFWLPVTVLTSQAHNGDAPLVAAVVGALVVAAVMLEVRRGTMNGATIALLGMLAALRRPAAAHRPPGWRQRHLLPRGAGGRRVRTAVRPPPRPVRDGGVGHHHRRHRAVAAVPDAGARLDGAGAGFVGMLTARLDPRLRGAGARGVRLGVGLRLRGDHEPVVLAVRTRAARSTGTPASGSARRCTATGSSTWRRRSAGTPPPPSPTPSSSW